MPGEERPTPLDRIIRAKIAADGPISVHDYMALCLGHPEHGYYRQREAIGRQGDFITAPEISQVFGELIGLWSAVTGAALVAEAPYLIVEIGPGRGTLMADALRAMKVVPGLLGRLALHLVEPSPALAQMQRATLADAPLTPTWHEVLETVPAGPSIILANEVIDVLPVHQLVRRGGAWRERVVALSSDGGVAFADADAAHDLEAGRSAPEGSILELRPGADRVLAAIAARARRCPTVALLIDYGHEQTGFGDTLQAVRRHDRADPLKTAGEADLTAQVDFEALTSAARRHGLEVDGPVPQAVFLGSLGIVERAQRLMRGAPPAQASTLEAGVLRLIDPAGMGSRFKVLGLRAPGLARLPGF